MKDCEMPKPDDGGPAFPSDFIPDPEHQFEWIQTGAVEMSLRDYFASKALMWLLSKLPVIDQEGTFGPSTDDKIRYNRDVAELCYWIADAMLLARQTHIT